MQTSTWLLGGYISMELGLLDMMCITENIYIK